MNDLKKLKSILNSIKKRWQLIAICTMITTIISLIATFFVIATKYQASTKLFIGKESSTDEKYNNNDIQMYQNLLKTYASIVKTNDLVSSALEEKGINLSSEAVISKLEVITTTNTQIMEVKYTSNNREEAKDVVEAITEEFIKKSESLITNANVQVIESVRLPKYPVTPNKKLNISIGVFSGFMLGIAIILILEYIDTTIKNKEDVEEFIGLTVIGVIPNEKIN